MTGRCHAAPGSFPARPNFEGKSHGNEVVFPTHGERSKQPIKEFGLPVKDVAHNFYKILLSRNIIFKTWENAYN